jgi:serine/threonine-protein kinase
MIRAGVLAQPAEVDRFYLEARAAAKLDHPNIISILEIGQQAGQHYFTMGFVSGGTLALKQEHYRADTRAAVALMVKISRAVHYAHERGILHRDLKPGNILLDEAGEPLVSDFGLAKFLDSQGGMTQTGQQMGTPAYMAPEQTSSGAGKITEKADIWALGVMLYELLTGDRPFTAAGSGLSHEICVSEPRRPSGLRSELGKDLETIILKCLEKSPPHRYDSAAALADDLERWLRGEPISARPLRWPLRSWRRCRRRPVLALTILAAILAATTLAAVILSHDAERWRRNHERALLAGQPAVLIGENSGPSGYRWVYGEREAKLTTGRDQPVELSSLYCALVELLPDPQIPRYRLRAQVMHANNLTIGKEVGIYFAHTAWPTEKGPVHCFYRVSFNDRENCLPDGNPNVNPIHVVLTVVGEQFPLQKSGRSATLFKLVNESRWRDLAVEVDPERFQVFWEGSRVDGGTWAELSQYACNYVKERSEHPALACLAGVVPACSPRQGLGLFVEGGGASFKNVVIEPLTDEK